MKVADRIFVIIVMVTLIVGSIVLVSSISDNNVKEYYEKVKETSEKYGHKNF